MLPNVTDGVSIIFGGIEDLFKLVFILLCIIAALAVGAIALFIVLTIALFSIVFGGVVLLLMP